MKCPDCQGSIDTTFHCVKCGESFEESFKVINRMRNSRKDEGDGKTDQKR